MKVGFNMRGLCSVRRAVLIYIGSLLAVAWLPTYAASLYLSRSSNGEWTLEFLAATGAVHSLEYTDDLQLSNGWSALPDFTPVEGSEDWIEHIETNSTAGAAQRFFRIRSVMDDVEPPKPVLALYTFTGDTLEAEETDPLVSTSALDITSGSVSTQPNNPELWTGSGIPQARGISGWSNSDPLDAKAFFFDLTAQSGHFLVLDELALSARATENGPSVMSIIFNDELIYTANMPNGEVTDHVIDLSAYVQLTQAVVRVAGWMNSSRPSTGAGWFEVDDILVNGTVEEIPPDFVTTPSAAASGPTMRDQTSASLAANVTQSGGATVTERGIVWSVDSTFDPLESGTLIQEVGEFTPGPFSVELMGLPPGTTIYYYAYAVNSVGTGLSPRYSFNTLSENTLVLYEFTGESLAPSGHHPAILPEELTASSGNINFGWVGASDWQAMGAENPYIGIQGWTATSQFTGRRFEIDLAADNGWLFSVTGVTFLARATAAGPSAIGVTMDEMSMHAENLPPDQVILVQGSVTNAVDLESAAIEIQGWLNDSRETTGGGHLRIDNVKISGSVSAAPPPEAP